MIIVIDLSGIKTPGRLVCGVSFWNESALIGYETLDSGVCLTKHSTFSKLTSTFFPATRGDIRPSFETLATWFPRVRSGGFECSSIENTDTA